MVKRSKRNAVSKILLCQYEQAWRNRSSLHSGRSSATVACQNFPVESLIGTHHAFDAKASEGSLATTLPIKLADVTNRGKHLIFRVNQKPSDSVFHQLKHSPTPVGNHRRSRHHSF